MKKHQIINSEEATHVRLTRTGGDTFDISRDHWRDIAPVLLQVLILLSSV